MRLPSPAMVVALIALIVAMSGSAYAVTQLPRNSVGAAQLKTSAVTAAKVKNNAVTTAKLRNNSITTAKIKNNAITDAKIKDDAVTGAKVKDGSLATNDLSAAAQSELRGTPLASAAVGATEDLALTNSESITVASTTITTTYAARLLINAAVAAERFDSGAGPSQVWVPMICSLEVGGTRAATAEVGVIDGLLPLSSLVGVTVPLVAGVDVEAGTHTVTAGCIGDYTVRSRQLTVAAFAR